MDHTIIGKIINTHGIKGEVKIYPLTDHIERFDDLKIAYIGESNIKVNIQNVRYHKGMVMLKFKEFNDINEVLRFKEQFLYVDDKDRIILPEDHFFIYDLVGCSVEDISGNIVGKLSDVIQGSSNDVYVIKDDEKQKEYLIPAVKQFIKKIDIESKLIIIDPIEGMIE